MNPADDPTFPTCPTSCTDNTDWCNHVRDILVKNKDAETIETGVRICVPLWPNYRTFAEVAIDTEEVMPGATRMALVKADPFTQEEELVELGLWSVGEGRFTIASVIKDWFRGQRVDSSQCKNSAHGYRESMMLDKAAADFKEVSDWYLLLHDMCHPCWTKNEQISVAMSSALSQVNDPQTGNANLAMNQLRNRFA